MEACVNRQYCDVKNAPLRSRLSSGTKSRASASGGTEYHGQRPSRIKSTGQLKPKRSRSVAWSCSTPKSVEFTAIALRWPAFTQRFEMQHRFTLLCHLQPQLLARLCLVVERLRNRRWAAHIAQKQDLYLKVAGCGLQVQQVADADLARSLSSLPIALNSAEFTCSSSNRACFEESGGPEPFVHSHAGHDPILV